MGRFPWVAFVVVTSTIVGGCSLPFGNDEPVSLPVTESPALQPSQPPASLPPQPNPILIQPTNPEQRIRMLKGGRADPFEALLPPAKAPTGSSQGSTTDPSNTTVTRSPNNQPDQTPNSFNPSLPVARPLPKHTAVKFLNSGSGRQGQTSKPKRIPVKPQPDTARGVQVTGVILVAGVPKAIVQVPGQTVSQSISRGECLVKGRVLVTVSQSISPKECLAKGRVLVKRIDVNRSEPVVILEQYGIEVALGVGKLTKM